MHSLLKPCSAYPKMSVKTAFLSDTAVPFAIRAREGVDGALSLHCLFLGVWPQTACRCGGTEPDVAPSLTLVRSWMLFVHRSINNSGFQQHWLNRLSL